MMRSERILLRAPEVKKDTSYIYHWENEPISWSSSETYNPISHDYIKEILIQSNHHLAEHRSMVIMIEYTKENKPIGYVQLLDFDFINRRTALGIYIAPCYRHQNFAKEAMNLLINYATERLRVSHFYAKILDNNLYANKLFQSIGFTKTAQLPFWEWSKDQYVALNIYQLWKR